MSEKTIWSANFLFCTTAQMGYSCSVLKLLILNQLCILFLWCECPMNIYVLFWRNFISSLSEINSSSISQSCTCPQILLLQELVIKESCEAFTSSACRHVFRRISEYIYTRTIQQYVQEYAEVCQKHSKKDFSGWVLFAFLPLFFASLSLYIETFLRFPYKSNEPEMTIYWPSTI